MINILKYDVNYFFKIINFITIRLYLIYLLTWIFIFTRYVITISHTSETKFIKLQSIINHSNKNIKQNMIGYDKYIELKKDVYHILPDGIFLIESLSNMNINMDKFKTSELGQALKKVYRGEIDITDSVNLAKQEISKVFDRPQMPAEPDTYTGNYGDVVGKCPLCDKEIVRGKYNYGCRGYKDGCKFSVSLNICSRNISVSNVKLLIETGRTSKIQGFVSQRTGKTFDAVLKLADGKAVFDFSN